MKTTKLIFFLCIIDLLKTDLNVGHEEYLTPAGAEENYVETLQNHQDDENIYNFGLFGQDHGDLVKMTKTYFSEFPTLMKIGKAISIIYNQDVKDFELEKSEEEEKELNSEEEFTVNEEFDNQGAMDMGNYFKGRKVYSLIFRNVKPLREEVKKIFDNLENLEITTEELLEIFDFEKYMKQCRKHLTDHDPNYLKNKREIDLLVFNFSTSVRDFLISIKTFENIGTVINSFMQPYKKDFLGKDPDNVVFKVDRGIKMVGQLISAKSFFDMLVTNIRNGIHQIQTIRHDVLYVIDKFKEIEAFRFDFKEYMKQQMENGRILEGNSFWNIAKTFSFMAILILF
jgi:hypothetical protein